MTDQRRYETIEVHRVDDVGYLVFDRPDVGNAINAQMFLDLEAAWAELDADPLVRVIVNTANGASFQTGVDMRQLAHDPAAMRVSAHQTRTFTLRLTSWHCGVSKPVIAAVNGVCAGGGLHFVADADIVIAGESATFLDPHVSVGQVSAFETIGLLKKSPMEPIVRMALLGRHERVDARRARELGILSEVVPDDRLRERAHEIAMMIARNPADELAATKQALWRALEGVRP